MQHNSNLLSAHLPEFKSRHSDELRQIMINVTAELMVSAKIMTTQSVFIGWCSKVYVWYMF